MAAGSRPGERRGGRQKGTPNKNTSEVRKIASEYGYQAIHKLAELAGLTDDEDGTKMASNEQARVAACNAILDRAYGKPTQAHAGPDGSGPMTIQIITGVPRSADD